MAKCRDPQRGRGTAEKKWGTEPTARVPGGGAGGTEQWSRLGSGWQLAHTHRLHWAAGSSLPQGKCGSGGPWALSKPPVPRALTLSSKGHVERIVKFHQHSHMSHPRSTRPGLKRLKETCHPNLTPSRQTMTERPWEGCGHGRRLPCPSQRLLLLQGRVVISSSEDRGIKPGSPPGHAFASSQEPRLQRHVGLQVAWLLAGTRRHAVLRDG